MRCHLAVKVFQMNEGKRWNARNDNELLGLGDYTGKIHEGASEQSS